MSDLRDLTVGITFNDLATKDIERVDKKVDEVKEGFSGVSAGISKAENDIKGFGKTGENSAGGLVSAFKRAAGVVAGFFALDKLKDFGVGMVTASAEMQALSAQFDQVFGADAGEARGVVENLGDAFGMLPNRIKPAYTQMTSMFKGLGLETGEAMDQATKAVTLVADAAAFYDKSFEDANSALNSFVKGNYEGGESIGLFANETQLAAWAAKNLKKDWKKLDEAGKQVIRLSYAEAMQKAAGATGQAKRESDGFQNQLGNLKQSWQDLMSKLGENILPSVVSAIQSLSESITKIDTESISSGFQSLKENLTPAFATLKSGLGWVKDNWPAVRDGLIGLGIAVVSFKTIMAGMTIVNTVVGFFKAWRAASLGVAIAQLSLNAAMWASPLTWIVAGIAAVIAIGVLLWKNWDTVKVAAQALWDKVKSAFSGIQSAIGIAASFIMDKMSSAWNFVKESAASALNGIIGGINKMIKTINKIPGVNIPLVAKVKVEKVDGSHATGLASVPRDNYVANLHRGESVLTAKQSDALRSAGILSANANGTPNLKLGGSSPSPAPVESSSNSPNVKNIFNINVQGGSNPNETALLVRKEVENIFTRLNLST